MSSRPVNLDYFPYALRDAQLEPLTLVQQKIKEGNICFDAPTGFGKTPVVLASLLPYVDDSHVLWAVRTGNETDRPIEELKRIAKSKDLFGFSYRGKKDMCLLARDIGINTYEGVSVLCRLEGKRCKYKQAFEEFFDPDEFTDSPKLYSEIINICKRDGICPYMAQSSLLNYANVVSLNYNYIVNNELSRVIRRSIPFDRSYLVVDEAHNLQNMGLNSDSITINTFRHALGELNQFDNTEDEQYIVNKMMRQAVQIQKDLSKAKKQESEFYPEDFLQITDCHETTLEALSHFGAEVHKLQLSKGETPHSSLHHMANFWSASVVCSRDGVAFIASLTSHTLKLERCDMRAAEVLKERWPEFKACVFCSGTLKPVKAFAETIGLKKWDSVHVSLCHDDRRVQCLIPRGLTTKGQELKKEMRDQYLDAIDSYLKLDANLAIFSSSYRIQNALIGGGLKGIVEKNCKELFQEVRGMSGDQAREILDNFKDAEKGVLCAPMTGRFAEGADFPGDELEGIFLVGVPFDQLSLRTRLYSDYYKEQFGERMGNYYSYVIPAFRRASQALGRVLRSEEDRGVFILGDERYAEFRFLKLLPDFVRSNVEMLDPCNISRLILGFFGP